MSTALLNRTRIRGDVMLAHESNLEGAGVRDMALYTTSDGKSETYGMAGNVPKFSPRRGQVNVSTLGVYRISIDNQSFSAAVDVPVEDIEDDNTGQITQKMQGLGVASANLDVASIGTLLKNGDTTTNGNAFDDKKFFAASAAPHAYGKSGSWINDLVAADAGMAALNVADPDNPTVEECSLIMMAMIGQLKQARDDQGNLINQNAMSFGWVGPANLWSPFNQAIYATNLAGGKTNPLQQFQIGAYINGEVDWTREFSMFVRDGAADKPFIAQIRMPLRVTTLDLDNAPAFVDDTDNVRVSGKRRCGYGYGLFTSIAKGLLS